MVASSGSIHEAAKLICARFIGVSVSVHRFPRGVKRNRRAGQLPRRAPRSIGLTVLLP